MAKVNSCKFFMVGIAAMFVDGLIAEHILARYNISWPMELPPKLKTITVKDYERVIQRILQFIEAIEKNQKAELILSGSDFNCLEQPFYESYSKLPASEKAMSFFRSYDIQNNIVIEEEAKILVLMSFFKKEKYCYQKQKINITLEAGALQEKVSIFMMFNQETGDFPYGDRATDHSYEAKNLIEYVLVAPYKNSIKQLNSSEREVFKKALDSIKTIEVKNDSLIIRT